MIDLSLPKGSRVVVAMSGGVDSSVVAALVHEAGYEVVGLTMQLYDQGAMAQKKGACCAGQDIYDAKQVASRIGFPHYVMDYESVFKQSVIDNFADEYMVGNTPIPCIRCNQSVKFDDLLKKSQELGASAMCTGHYIQRVMTDEGKLQLHAGLDPNKDQSYFLFATTYEQLDFVHFPLGGMTKAQTREHAQRFGLDVAAKPDSKGICFVPDGNYAAIVAKLRPEALKEGEIRHVDGRLMGYHKGIIGFTIGQRKGLNLGVSYPLYVTKIDADNNTVYVGPKEALACHHIEVSNINWLAHDLVNGTSNLDLQGIQVKIRSLQMPIPANIKVNLSKKEAVVELINPEYGISSGQACVIYKDSRMLGGGWINKNNDK